LQYSLKEYGGTKKDVTGKYTVKKESCLYLGNSEYGVLECNVMHGLPDQYMMLVIADSAR
jgi:hypothetical protein